MPEKASNAAATAVNVPNAVKVLGEVFAPGVTLLLGNDVKKGLLHFGGAVLGRAVLGPLGWFWAAANSYSQSTTGKHLHQHF